MEHRPDLAATLQNLDTRLANVERILPTLATKDDLRGMHTAGDPKGFATREDLQAFAMKDDLQAFATKDDLKAFAVAGAAEPSASCQTVPPWLVAKARTPVESGVTGTAVA